MGRRANSCGWLAALLGLAAAGAARADVILHAFNWRYAEVEQHAAEIGARGYRAVLVSPPLRSEGSAWWARYQPQDYRVLDNPLGNRESFERMAATLATHGVALHADLVLNHMANEAALRPGLDYPGARVLGAYQLDPAGTQRQRLFGDLASNLFGAQDFNEARCITDYSNLFQVQTWRLCGGGGDPGLPDLAPTDRVVAAQRNYLEALRALGVSGFRIDAAKHMPGSHIRRVFEGAPGTGAFVYGELITGGGVGNTDYRLFLEPWIATTPHAAYDFPLFHATRNAFAFGARLDALADVATRGQALPGARAVTFAVNHDIPNNQGFRGLLMDPVDETLAWAWLIGRGEGSPLIYSDHNESGDNRWVKAWRRDDLTRMVAFHNATRGAEFTVLSAGACHLLFRRGQRGMVGINKCAQAQAVTLPAGRIGLNPLRRYAELLAGGSYRPGTDEETLTLPPRAARMWLLGK